MQKPPRSPILAEPPALHLGAILLGGLIAFLVLHVGFAGAQQDFAQLALGDETQAFFASVDGQAIHCLDLNDAPACLAGYRARGSRPLAVWLGNSQIHAVNQLQPGQQSAPALLHERLARDGFDLLAFSQPNANLQEHLVLFTYLLQHLPVRVLVLPLVFDDLRETGLRAGIASALRDPGVDERLGHSEVGRRILAGQGQQGDDELAALHETVQESSEAALTAWLEVHSDLWAARPQVRGALFNDLYNLRNTVFGIDAQSKRRMIPGRMQVNLAAAEELLRMAADAGVRVVTYTVPLRNDVEVPYVASEYAVFKRRVARMSAEAGAIHADLESLVPASLWGSKRATDLDGKAELDFMHFQAGGHVLLARAIGDLVEPLLEGPRP